MKLLVFAHTPPPVHGQSVMVQTMLDGLRRDPRFEVYHVNLQLSRDSADIGRWRLGKFFALLAACVQAWRVRWRHGPAVLYYVPAPGKRSALYRDFVVMALCRPLFPQLVLHWHASGLGEWLQTKATRFERTLAQRLLGRADLAIVLAPSLAGDSRQLEPRQVAIVPNCITAEPFEPRSEPRNIANILFVGLCARTKGVDDLLDAMALLDARAPGRFKLTLAGDFPDAQQARAVHARLASLRAGLVEHVGFADESKKKPLFATADVFCFPTRYPHEGQPLVLIEALAYDIRIVATRWRAIPDMLPAEHVWLVEPSDPAALAVALEQAVGAPPANGALRRVYEAQFTPERHLAILTTAVLGLEKAAALPANATAVPEKRA